jgi:hypothetical protein
MLKKFESVWKGFSHFFLDCPLAIFMAINNPEISKCGRDKWTLPSVGY